MEGRAGRREDESTTSTNRARRHPTHSLRIALLAYRGNPHSGGQGVYVRHLSRALVDLGHQVEVLAGQPYPELDPGVRLTTLPSLDLYRPELPFTRARPIRNAIDLLEFSMMCVAGFPEPLTFSLRAWRELAGRHGEFDVVHDNQCLGYGLLGIRRLGLPELATIHHPVRVDRALELQHAGWQRRIAIRRWYAFTRMQARVARRLDRLLTVSAAAAAEIEREMGVRPERLAVVPNGVNTELFKPLPHRARTPGLLLATASADVPLKGLVPLLEALARLRVNRPAELVIVGRPQPNGSVAAAIERLQLEGAVRFVSAIPETGLVELYARAEVAVVPSLYEGFSLPAVEAMACAVPLVATTAGGLPEVVGPDGEAGLLVPPGDSAALAAALGRALEDAGLRRRLGERGRARALTCFSWRRAAEATVEQYRMVIAGC